MIVFESICAMSFEDLQGEVKVRFILPAGSQNKNPENCVCTCFRCECTPGYVGEHCESDYNDCEENKCQNGGQCIDAINGYTCVCPEGYR